MPKQNTPIQSVIERLKQLRTFSNKNERRAFDRSIEELESELENERDVIEKTFEVADRNSWIDFTTSKRRAINYYKENFKVINVNQQN